MFKLNLFIEKGSSDYDKQSEEKTALSFRPYGNTTLIGLTDYNRRVNER